MFLDMISRRAHGMYPNGVWHGHWEQPGLGRQPMNPINLYFAEGKVTGNGLDLIGPFDFTGTYDHQGGVKLIKQYVGRHRVAYVGRWDGEGMIDGVWHIPPYWSGSFVLHPERRAPSADAPIQDLFPRKDR